jgi:hypothetical protein
MRKTRRSFSVEAGPSRARRWRRCAAPLAIAVAGFVLGCGAACDTSDDGNVPERYTGGTSTAGVYESSPWKSGLLPFPGGKQYQLEHHLGFTPSIVQIFLAFSPEREELAPCSGNSCLVRCVDDEMIWIKNDTCAEFWVRVSTAGRSNESRYRLCTDTTFDASAASDAGTANDSSAENAPESAPEASSADVGSDATDASAE